MQRRDILARRYRLRDYIAAHPDAPRADLSCAFQLLWQWEHGWYTHDGERFATEADALLRRIWPDEFEQHRAGA